MRAGRDVPLSRERSSESRRSASTEFRRDWILTSYALPAWTRYGKRADLIVHEEEPFNAETGLCRAWPRVR